MLLKKSLRSKPQRLYSHADFDEELVGMWEEIEKLRAGDHVAMFYQSRAEQFAAIVPYIAVGLERKERCLYIADDNSVPLVLQQLEVAGIDVDGALESGALKIATKNETYLRDGVFEPAKMIADLRAEVTQALKDGFTAFRATGEMTWALSLPSGLSRLSEYERRLHAEFPAEFVAVCQYNETSFDPHVISDMIRIHPRIIARGRVERNPFHGTSPRTDDCPILTIEGILVATGHADAHV